MPHLQQRVPKPPTPRSMCCFAAALTSSEPIPSSVDAPFPLANASTHTDAIAQATKATTTCASAAVSACVSTRGRVSAPPPVSQPVHSLRTGLYEASEPCTLSAAARG